MWGSTGRKRAGEDGLGEWSEVEEGMEQGRKIEFHPITEDECELHHHQFARKKREMDFKHGNECIGFELQLGCGGEDFSIYCTGECWFERKQ